MPGELVPGAEVGGAEVLYHCCTASRSWAVSHWSNVVIRIASVHSVGASPIQIDLNTQVYKPLPFVGEQDKETWKSVHQGAMHLGMACSQGIRNPQAHKTAPPLTEQETLEQLGALSVLARWMDMSVLVVGDLP